MASVSLVAKCVGEASSGQLEVAPSVGHAAQIAQDEPPGDDGDIGIVRLPNFLECFLTQLVCTGEIPLLHLHPAMPKERCGYPEGEASGSRPRQTLFETGRCSLGVTLHHGQLATDIQRSTARHGAAAVAGEGPLHPAPTLLVRTVHIPEGPERANQKQTPLGLPGLFEPGEDRPQVGLLDD
jgi:hypothetical protein